MKNFFNDFKIWGESNKNIQNLIYPELEIRSWNELKKEEKQKIFSIFHKHKWFRESSRIVRVIEYFEYQYPRLNLAENLFHTTGIYEKKSAAYKDFYKIFINSDENIVYQMLSLFSKELVSKTDLNKAKNQEQLDQVFSNFDKFCDVLNNIFEKFFLNLKLTRLGIVPTQDEKIIENIYNPVMKILSAKKWTPINKELHKSFSSFQAREYEKSISEAHNVVQGFLQILIHGEHGKNSTGEIGKLFSEAKKNDIFSEDFDFFKNFFSAFRANKSLSKPQKQPASQEDSLLMLNLVMIFLQYGLSKS